jgi:hypothetical protein
MAVVALKSTPITNRDATPGVLNEGRMSGGLLRHARGVITTGAADTTASTYRFFQLPSNALLVRLSLTTDGAGTVGAMDVGIYRTTADGGAVVSAGLFTTAKVLTTPLVSFDALRESTTIAIAASDVKPLWQWAGLTADPRVVYDVVGTLTATVDAAHNMLLECDYTV